ncbi:MAG TPA: delta-60 repeat domain-containing protein, partial [Burkholderiales bacterium]|nr:delta-60 repeat domain-containing protein [Burkholderiales bacterium]
MVVAGQSHNGSDWDIALARYNADGSLDTGFDSDGKLTVAIGPADDYAFSLALQPDGKMLLAGYTWDGVQSDFVLLRYNANGSVDTAFDGDGKLTTAIGPAYDEGWSVAVQPDGKILVGGHSYDGSNDDFALVRYNADGSLDASFDSVEPARAYTENGAAVVLDSDIRGYDAELATQGHYAGASVTLARSGGANAEDVFSATGALDALVQGGGLVYSGVTVGTVTSNSGGMLVLTFDANATQARVDGVLQSIAYSNASDGPPSSVQIDWTLSDGNSGAQGTGGALSVTASTTVAITPVNEAPVLGDGKVTTGVGTAHDVSRSIMLQPDGRIVLAGWSQSAGASRFAAVRYNASGSLDTTFDGDGKVTTAIGTVNDAALGVTRQADGKIVLAGYTWNGTDYDFAAVRYNANGSLDTTFHGDGKLTTAIGTDDDVAWAVALQPDGRIVVAGYSLNASNNNDVALVRYDANGGLDTTFDGDGKLTTPLSAQEDFGLGIATQTDGKILV